MRTDGMSYSGSTMPKSPKGETQTRMSCFIQVMWWSCLSQRVSYEENGSSFTDFGSDDNFQFFPCSSADQLYSRGESGRGCRRQQPAKRERRRPQFELVEILSNVLRHLSCDRDEWRESAFSVRTRLRVGS